jgi:hypothetical protein
VYEIMGVMYGKVKDHTFWIMDAAALPVQGTETRVNAGNEVSDEDHDTGVRLMSYRLWNTWCNSRWRMMKLEGEKC